MPNLIEKGLRTVPLSSKIEEMREALNREWFPVLEKLRALMNERKGFVRDVSADYDLDVGDEEIRVDTTDGSVTVSLMVLAQKGKTIYITKHSTDGNVVLVSPGGVKPIFGGGFSITTVATAALRYDDVLENWIRLF